MPDLPTGTVTLLFTDIEGSTQLLQRLGPRYGDVLAEYRSVLRSIFQTHGGQEVDTQGDSFFVAFPRALDVLQAAVEIQRAVVSHPWPEGLTLATRMGLHTGEPQRGGEGYVGLDVHRAARIGAAGHGGQILLSNATHAIVVHDLPEDVQVRDLGEHRLKDLQHPEHIFQVAIPDLPADFPPLKTVNLRPNNLPLLRDPLIGREHEMAVVTGLLRRDDVGLVTLAGAGGSGKTRLALQVAIRLLDDFPDGVFFVDIAPVSDPALVAATIATTLGLRDVGGEPLHSRLQAYLREKQLLLLLDNFEQVIPAAPMLATLLQAAPGLKLLVTSRAALRLYGEREVPVPPLALPDLAHLPSVDQLAQYAAVRLFVERAQAIKPDFALTPANAEAVAAICVRLDGMPLALELAAARLKLLSPQAMLARLSSRFALLTTGPRDRPTRQQTLCGAIAWSYDLLDPEEQRLFTRLAVFVGGWTVEAAEAVCNGDGSLGLDALDGLQSLLDKNLVRQVEGVGGEPRFRRLETIREYALERLAASGEGDALRQQHATSYLHLVEGAQPRLVSTHPEGIFLRLEEEQDNLRAALNWVITRRETEMALRLTAGLNGFWAFRGRLSEGRSWIQEALALPGSRHESAMLRAQTVVQAGWLAATQGDFGAGQSYLEQAQALFQREQASTDAAFACRGLACIAWAQGDYQTAQAYQQESLALCRSVGTSVGIAWSLHDLATCLLWAGELERAMTFNEEALASFQELGERGLSFALLTAGQLALARGAAEEGMTRFRACLRLGQAAEDTLLFCYALMAVASLRGAQGQSLDVARLGGAVETARREISVVLLPRGEREAYERALAHARSGVDAAAWQAAWQEGQAMTLEQAIAYALEEADA